MKTLLIGLLALGSISVMASDCNISMWTNDSAINLNDTNFVSQAQKIALRKGLILTVDADTVHKVYFRGIVYMHEGSGPKVFTPAGAIASLESADSKVSAKTEDLLVLKSREHKRLQRLALKSLRKVIQQIPFCN